MNEEIPNPLLDDLEGQTLDIIDSLNRLSTMIERYEEPATEKYWFRAIQKLEEQYGNLLSVCHQNAGTPFMQEQYPYKLLSVIDKNESPDQYLQTVKQESQKHVEYANGKKFAIEELRKVLREEIDEHFPNTK